MDDVIGDQAADAAGGLGEQQARQAASDSRRGAVVGEDTLQSGNALV
ncbi:hypothetical protein [Streptomyces sp. NPDC088762]